MKNCECCETNVFNLNQFTIYYKGKKLSVCDKCYSLLKKELFEEDKTIEIQTRGRLK